MKHHIHNYVYIVGRSETVKGELYGLHGDGSGKKPPLDLEHHV